MVNSLLCLSVATPLPRHEAGKLSSRWLKKMASSKVLPDSQRKIVLEAADRMLESDVRRGALRQRGTELAELRAEVIRLREQARALGSARGAAGKRVGRPSKAARRLSGSVRTSSS